MRQQRTIVAFLMVFAFTNAIANELPKPVFENPSEEITESGYVKLSWQWGYPHSDSISLEFELQQSENENLEEAMTIYKGPDYATFLSGQENGNYYYRVRAIFGDDRKKSDWSSPIVVGVKHHSLQLAFTLFGIGAIVFLLTIGIVIQGIRTVAQNH